MKKIKRIYIITLTLLAFSAGIVLGSEGIVNHTGVRMRTGPSTQTEIITNLSSGDRVEIVERSGNWYRIRHNDTLGYMHSDYVDIIEVPVESNNEETETATSGEVDTYIPDEESIFPQSVVMLSETRMHIIPSLSSSVLTEIADGRTITVYRRINNWSYISYENQRGWARIELPSGNNEENANSNNYEDVTIENNTHRFINASVANVRQAANTTSEIVGTLARGVRVTVVGESNDWYRIEFDGLTGYIMKSLVSEEVSATPTVRGNEEPRQAEVTPITRYRICKGCCGECKNRSINAI
ncbi:MAG: SH3 domain-containing protein [Oscillospiraceae bacterium]|nr:SH3 domain-containing protein [Oscillospiraceae bacterium]